MTMATETPLTLANYQLRLSSFEGPLDVLLRLIERSQLAITDVSLAAVTDQFLEYAATLEHAKAEVIAEFVAMGARLTVLKSRSLLPRPPALDEEPEPSDLTRQLQAYKQLKDAAQQLAERHAAGVNSFVAPLRGAVAIPADGQPPRLAQYGPEVLLRSLRRRLSVVPRAAQVVRQRRVVSLRDMIDHVVSMTGPLVPVRFSRVAADCRTRSELATAFLAVLVLVRRQSLDVAQPELFGDIELSGSSAQNGLDGLDNDADEFGGLSS